MKILRKILNGFVLISFIGLNFSNVTAEGEAVSVSDIVVNNTRSISATLDNPIDTNSLTNAELKIMHDIPVEKVELDIADARKATLTLDSSLAENTVYNLISITGVDGSMDFETADNLDGEELLNTSDEGIQSILILNPKVIEVIYYEAISENEIELKLLKDLQIESIESESDVKFNVKTAGKLEVSSNYIFMLLASKTTDGGEAEIENGIYDFDVEDTLAEYVPEVVVAEVVEEVVIVEEEVVVTNDTELNEQADDINSTTEEETNGTELNAASETEPEGNLTKAGVTGSGSNIEEIAGGVTEVPTTGAATNVILILTLLGAMGMNIRRKK